MGLTNRDFSGTHSLRSALSWRYYFWRPALTRLTITSEQMIQNQFDLSLQDCYQFKYLQDLNHYLSHYWRRFLCYAVLCFDRNRHKTVSDRFKPFISITCKLISSDYFIRFLYLDNLNPLKSKLNENLWVGFFFLVFCTNLKFSLD